jgi:transposase
MAQETREVNSTPKGPTLYMALELSQATWKLGFSDGQARQVRVVTVAARVAGRLMEEVAKAKRRVGLPAEAEVVACQEAGRDGFSVHRLLEGLGIRSLVVDAASIEVNRRQRRAKTDRLDAERLAALLVRYLGGEQGVWSVVRVPTEAQEEERQLHRERGRLVKERTAHTNRIKGLLAQVGVVLKVGRGFRERIEGLRTLYGTELSAGLKADLFREYERRELVEGQIRELEAEQRRRIEEPRTEMDRQAARLAGLRGIGTQGSWVLAKEFFGWRRFRNRREVGAAAGAAATPYSSGASERDQGISKAGNRRVRAVMAELAWSWLRFQPESDLSDWYRRRFAGGGSRGRRKGIVALSRKLLVQLWKYLEYGLAPEGAQFKGEGEPEPLVCEA